MLNSITSSVDMRLSKLQEMVKDREAWHAAVHGVGELDTAEQLNNNKGFSTVQFSCSVMLDSLQPHGLQCARSPCPSPTPRVYSNSCALSP